jgi:hypothetical protein
MDSLIIEPTEYSPSVDFNTSTYRFLISGESRPENCGKFYTPVVTWLNKYEQELSSKNTDGNTTLTFVFKFDYFNSTSAKFIMNLLQIIKKIEVSKKYKVVIEWFYDEMDEDMMDAGKEFCEAAELEFKFSSY